MKQFNFIFNFCYLNLEWPYNSMLLKQNTITKRLLHFFLTKRLSTGAKTFYYNRIILTINSILSSINISVRSFGIRFWRSKSFGRVICLGPVTQCRSLLMFHWLVLSHRKHRLLLLFSTVFAFLSIAYWNDYRSQ